MSSIYMYHAVGDDAEIIGSDPYYAVTADSFEAHLSQIKCSVPIAQQIENSGRVTDHCITFDDGHLSNYTVAFPLLKKAGLLAEFYINTAFVGDAHYMTWPQLQEMANAGMSIQSHAHHHHYVSDLNEEEIFDELATSKAMIEEKLGTKVIVFAPPGGRIDARVVRIAQQIGYRCISTSVPQVVTQRDHFLLPRFAVLATTPSDRIAAWLRPYSYDTLRERVRFHSFALVKKSLGNQNYEKLRGFLLGRKTVA